MGEEVSGINGGRRWLNRLHKDRIRAMNTEQREEGFFFQLGSREGWQQTKQAQATFTPSVLLVSLL